METKILITIAILFLIGFFVIFSVTVFMKDKKNVKPLWSQYFTVQIAIALIVIPASLGMIPFFVVVTFIAIKSQYELIRATIDDPDPLHRNIALFAGVIIMAFGLSQNESAILILLLGTLSLFLFLDIFRKGNFEMKSETGSLTLSLIYPVTFTVFFLFIYNLPKGLELMIFFYLVSEVNNSFAQLMGRALGEKKIFPRLSPNKTRVGLLWGMSVALMTGIIANHITFGFTLVQVIPGVLLIIVGSILGDLIPSKIKRNNNVKDFGNFLPLHGGVLDIYDSIIFTAPFFYWYAILFLC